MTDYTPGPTPFKQCRDCKTSKPATSEYFARQKQNRDGLSNQCKACAAEYGKAWRAANAESQKQKSRDYHLANKERHNSQARAHYHANKQYYNDKAREWRLANSEHLAEYERERRAKRKEYMSTYLREYHQANRDKHIEHYRANYQANKERHAKASREWRSANRERFQANIRNRKARKKNAEGKHTGADIARQLAAQKEKCYWCGIKVSDTYHVDHIVPLARSGSNWPENIVISCPTCNCSRGDKLPHEWPQGNRLL